MKDISMLGNKVVTIAKDDFMEILRIADIGAKVSVMNAAASNNICDYCIISPNDIVSYDKCTYCELNNYNKFQGIKSIKLT